MNQFGKHTDDSVSLRYFRSQFISYFFYLITCARYSALHKIMTLELARPLLKKSSCAACIMRRALVFHLDPAAPVPTSAAVDLSSPLITDLLITSQLLITTHHNSSQLITPYHIPSHHSSTSHTSLITAPLLITTHHSSTSHRSTSHHNSSQLTTSQPITAPLLTAPLLITTHHNSSQLITTHHNSSQLITAPLLTGPLLITTHHNLSHPNSSQLHFSHPFSHLTHHIRTHHSSTSHT